MARQARMPWLLLAAALVSCVCLVACGLDGFGDDINAGASVAGSAGEVWDEDEFEGMETLSKDASFEDTQAAGSSASMGEPGQKDATARPTGLHINAGENGWWPEIAAVCFLAVYVWYYVKGRAANERIATAFVDAFAREGGVFERNFDLLGGGRGLELLMKDGQACFKLYASGRRYCTSLMATLDLRRRQDLLSCLWDVMSPSTDVVDIEVTMNDASMAPMVLLLASPKVAKDMIKDSADLEYLAHRVEVTRDRLASFPVDRLAVYAEHSSLVYDLMVPQAMELALGKAQFEPLAKYWRYAHFTTENTGAPDEPPPSSGGTPRAPPKVLRFSFTLPPPERMGDLSRLLALVMLYIDVVGGYRLTPEQEKRAAKVRQDAAKATLKERHDQRMEELAKKKAEAKQSELERVRKLGPEARRKFEEKRERQQAKKQAKSGVKMIK